MLSNDILARMLNRAVKVELYPSYQGNVLASDATVMAADGVGVLYRITEGEVRFAPWSNVAFITIVTE